MKNKYSIKEHIIITILFIITIITLWYYNPVSETAYCDANYHCNIVHKHTGNIKTKSQKDLQKCLRFYEVTSGFNRYQERHIAYSTPDESNLLLLRKGVCSFKEGDLKAYNACRSDIQNLLINLDLYLKGENKEIIIAGNGGINYLKKYFLALLLLYIIGMITNKPMTIIIQNIIKLYKISINEYYDKIENSEYYGINRHF